MNFLPADDSHEISFKVFCVLQIMNNNFLSQILSTTEVVIDRYFNSSEKCLIDSLSYPGKSVVIYVN